MTNINARLLIVDDDPTILFMLKKGLANDRNKYEILMANDGQKALTILDREKIDLVVSDINMPIMTGLDLLATIRVRYPETKVILMTGYSSRKVREQVKESGCLYFLEKPVDLGHLKELIAKEISQEKGSGFAGTLSNIQLDDLIQMCCLSAISTAIRARKGDEVGTLFIEEGEIIHAVYKDLHGEEAFYEILAWRSGSFETLGNVPVAEVTIDKNWQFLLMEGLRRVDEKAIKAEEESKEGDKNTVAEKDTASLRVLIVDDSSMMCRILTDMLESDKGIKVIGTAKNGEEALDKIDRFKPDLITLDVNMPVMDGSTAIKHIMIKTPCPVIIVSNPHKSSQVRVLDFLLLGAVDFINKPVKRKDMSGQQNRLISSVKTSAMADTKRFKRIRAPKAKPAQNKHEKTKRPCGKIVVLCSGAGGYAELIRTIPLVSRNTNAGIIAIQHMPEGFVSSLASYLNKRSQIPVYPITEETPVFGGSCYVGACGSPFSMQAEGLQTIIKVGNKLPGEHDQDNTDSFFSSIADEYSGRMLVVLFSGANTGSMEGLKRIRERDGQIIIQKLDTCMVAGSLEAAIKNQLVSAEADTAGIIKAIAEK